MLSWTRGIGANSSFPDLPGYGYAKISKSISAGWPAFIEPYLAGRDPLALCICLVDANVPPQASDRQLFDWLRAAGREFLVVATKVDRLSGNERTRNLAALKKGLELDEILPVSAKTGYGVKELWARIECAGGSERGQANLRGRFCIAWAKGFLQTAIMRADFKANRNLAAIHALPHLLGKASGKLTVTIKQAQAMRHAGRG